MNARRRILAIDPGMVGGIAIIDGAVLVAATDIPIIGTGAKTRVDVLATRTWIEMHLPVDHAAIERAGVMPKQGIASGFKYGRAVGALEAVIALLQLGLYGTDKEASRQRALQLFPAGHHLLALKKHHGRAEAALIALSLVGARDA